MFTFLGPTLPWKNVRFNRAILSHQSKRELIDYCVHREMRERERERERERDRERWRERFNTDTKRRKGKERKKDITQIDRIIKGRRKE